MLLNRVFYLSRSKIKPLSIRNKSNIVATAKIVNDNSNSEKSRTLQESALDEECILVDHNDRVIGSTSKKDCHRVYNGNEIKLHRAFSVFLFNSNGDMLIQRRSKQKV